MDQEIRGSIDPKLLQLLACPLTKGPLEFDPEQGELISVDSRLAYPVRDGIPVMLPSEARQLDSDDPAIVKKKR